MSIRSLNHVTVEVGELNVAVAESNKIYIFEGEGVAVGDAVRFVGMTNADCNDATRDALPLWLDYGNDRMELLGPGLKLPLALASVSCVYFIEMRLSFIFLGIEYLLSLDIDN